MNLDNLKPAWRQFQLMNSMQAMDQKEMLYVLEKAEGMAINKAYRFLMHSVLFIILTIGCQGG